jgi:hypothetical protein
LAGLICVTGLSDGHMAGVMDDPVQLALDNTVSAYSISLDASSSMPHLPVKFHARRADAVAMISTLVMWSVFPGGTDECCQQLADSCRKRRKRNQKTHVEPDIDALLQSPKVFALAVQILDKFLVSTRTSVNGSTRFNVWKDADFTGDDTHTLRVYAAACFSIAFKTELSHVVLASAQLYECVLMRWKHEGVASRAQEKMYLVHTKYADRNYRAPSHDSTRDAPMVDTMRNSWTFKIEAAEVFVLRGCGWNLGSFSTVVDKIDRLLDGAVNDSRFAQIHTLSYNKALRFLLDSTAVYSSSFSTARCAMGAVCEALLTLKIPIDSVAGLVCRMLGAVDA